jgi:hypothetical protein
MIDRDGDTETAELNKNKARIMAELGQDSCWVTQGRVRWIEAPSSRRSDQHVGQQISGTVREKPSRLQFAPKP